MSTQNKHDAVGSMAGMVYQVYYYLKRLLLLRPTEVASLELHDDVAISDGEGIQYCQLKHTGELNKLMTQRDHDLWKTLAMWVEIIQQNRTEEEQKQWISNCKFILLTNKSVENNPFRQRLLDYQNSEDKWVDLDNHMKEQASKNSDKKDNKNDVDKYAQSLYEYSLRKEFLKNVEIIEETDDEILESITDVLEINLHVKRNNAMHLRTYLLGKLNESFVNTVQKKKPSVYSDKTFHEEYGLFISSFRDRKFIVTNQKVTLPDKVKMREQTFIRQLMDINDHRVTTEAGIVMLTTERLEFENDYNSSLPNITPEEKEIFEKSVHSIWYDIFWTHNLDVEDKPENEKINAANKVLIETRRQTLLFSKDEMSHHSTNGCYYYFSDGNHPTIGWHFNWMNMYNGLDWIEKYGSASE